MTDTTDALLRNWLLRRCDAAVAEEMEMRLLVDDEFAARVLDQEHDLIDDYVAGRLDAEQCRAFQQYVLPGADGQLRLILARALLARRSVPGSAIGTAPVGRRPARAWALGFAGAAAIAMLAAFLMLRGGHPASAPAMTREAHNAIPVLSLRASLQRGTSSIEAQLPNRGPLRLQAEVVDAQPDTRYALTVSSATSSVFSISGLRPRRVGNIAFVEAELPAIALPAGEWRVDLVAIGTGDDHPPYQWTVTHHSAE